MTIEDLRREVGNLRPLSHWANIRVDGVETWRRDEDVWDGAEPVEDHALPPFLDWSEAIEKLAESTYRVEYDFEFEEGSAHRISWPPTGNLWNPGAWYWTDPDQCGEHGDDYQDSCEECDSLDQQGKVHVEEQAQWDWSVRVEIYNDGDQVLQDRWEIGSTFMDPREVEYGPSRHHPLRQLLFMEAGIPS
jgi:hypothetical protein